MLPADLIKNSSEVATDEVNSAKARGSNKLGKDEFMKLLMAQLANQDPTAPTDSQAFVAQLASFATLEMQQSSNTHLENLLLAQASANQTNMASFVGRDVVFKSDSLHLGSEGSASAAVELSGAAMNVTAVVTDASGKTVRTMQLGRKSAGSMALEWDGRDDNGRRVPAGEYKLRVTAQDDKDQSVAVEQRGLGHVSGVAYDSEGVAMLKVGNTKIKVSDLVEINERNTP